MKAYLPAIIAIICTSLIHADMLNQSLSSWHTNATGNYARIFETTADEAAGPGAAVITWSRGQGQQTQPTYAGVHEISYNNDSVYVRTTGLGTHIMGPWYLDMAKTNLFPDYPTNQAVIYRFPRDPGMPPASKTLTSLGRVGAFVDGVSMFDSRDPFSYDTSAGQDETFNSPPGVMGDLVWNRDAFVNEGPTFDAANAHPAGSDYHYHTNPPALRHQLGDSVDYNPATNQYTENFNGNHSPILGWVRDGYPIYGPYGYSNAMDTNSAITRMRSGFRKRTITQRHTLPAFAARDQGFTSAGDTSEFNLASNRYGPNVSASFMLGRYLEDYEYLGDFGQTQGPDFDLDEHNGRFCVTPEFPGGTYAYFITIQADGTPAFPYAIGRKYYGNPTGGVVPTVSGDALVVFEGGPEKKIKGPIVTNESDEITVTWSAFQGGTYVVESSNDLENWDTLSSDLNGDQLTTAENNATNERFYRTGLLDVAPFDSAGFSVQNSISVGGNNILLIIVDDWGIDSSPLDNPSATSHASMPTFQSLANQGLRFTNAYAQPTCSPTRANILTGRYSFRHGVGSPGGLNFPVSEFTLPDAFAAANSNYTIASIGKWHLGGGDTGPFDVGGWADFRGTLGASVASYTNWEKTINGVTTPGITTYTTTDQIDDTIAFINTQGAQPWMCWLALNAAHAPFDPPPPALLPSGSTGGGQRGNYERVLEAMDTELARLMTTVDLNTTNILLLGDNGTPNNSLQPPYPSGRAKGSLYEGGTHVPMIALGPDIRATGTCDDLVHCVDLYTTILHLAGIDQGAVAPPGTIIDGRSLFGILNGNGSVDGGIVVEDFGNNVTDPGRAIRIGDYKLILYDNGDEEFYNIANDPYENTELIILGLNTEQQAAYDALVARNTELENSIPPPPPAVGILSVSPNSGSTGATVRLTFNLDPAATNPAVPGLMRAVSSITLGGVSGVSITRPSRYVVEADFTLPLPGIYDAEVVFSGPEMRTFGKDDAFTVIP